jgi:hypothetical protein
MKQAVLDLLGYEFPEAGLNKLEPVRRPPLLEDKVRKLTTYKPFREEDLNRSPMRGEG